MNRKVKTTSEDFSNEHYSTMVKGLDDYFEKYKVKIEKNDFVNTLSDPGALFFIPLSLCSFYFEKGWKQAALRLTALEVPFIPESGAESGKKPKDFELTDKSLLFDGKIPEYSIGRLRL